MRKIALLFMLAVLLALPSSVAAGELTLSIQNGMVTLIAEDVPLSTILAEWARVGQTKIVNGDKILTPVSLTIVDTPERKALDILLRTASGYIAAERPTPIASASVFDRIMILPTSRPPANAPIAAPPPMFTPRPTPPNMPAQEVEDDQPRPVLPPGMGPQPPPQPNPMPAVPGQQQQPQTTPNAPMTSPRPGPLPAPPAQPVPFGTPPKPAGGGGGGSTFPGGPVGGGGL
jgi:hypothetical protein